MLLQVQQGFDYHIWVVLPLIIFISRVCDVTLGTLRNVMVSKGYRNIAPFLGFFEVLIWIVVVSQVMKNVSNVACYLGWAAGFATGTYVGLRIEERLALGLQVIRIITNHDCSVLIKALKDSGHGITVVDAHGAVGAVKLIYTIVKRKDSAAVEAMINQYVPSAFYSKEEVKSASAGVFSSADKNSDIFRRIFAGK
jgi:uncharacterized protein YebE (UPF0316 family)